MRKHTFDPSEKKKKNFNNKCIKTKPRCAPEIRDEEWRSSLNPKPCRTLETLRTDAFSTVRVGNLYCPDLRASSGVRRRRERGSLESEPGLTCVQSRRPKSWTKQARHRIPSLADPPACSFFPWSRERERDGSWSIVAMAKSVWSSSFLLLLLASTLLLQQSLTLVTGNRFPPTLSSRAAAALEHFFFLFLLSEKCILHSSCFEVVLSCVRCASGWICRPLKSAAGIWSQSSLLLSVFCFCSMWSSLHHSQTCSQETKFWPECSSPRRCVCMSFIWFCRLWVAASKHSEDWIGWATGTTKDEEDAVVEAGGGAARGEDPSQVGLLDEQISGASSVVDDLLLGPAAGVNTVFYFPKNPTKCKWQIYTGARYVTLQIKIGWRNVKTCQFGSAKWFWPNIFAQLVKGISKPNTCQRRV